MDVATCSVKIVVPGTEREGGERGNRRRDEKERLERENHLCI